nr:PREDICTED: origin recognition complex subunit 3 [Bemisia tabaci]
MDPTNSISEGVFAFNPKPKKSAKNRKTPNEFAFFKQNDWYKSFDSVWSEIHQKVVEEENKITSELQSKVNKFAHSAESSTDTIPTIIMLTGVNLSDHKQLFKNIDDYILNNSKSFTATLWADSCTNIRNMIESLVYQIETTGGEPDSEYLEHDEDSDSEEHQYISIKRANQTLPHLVNWFNNLEANQAEEPTKKKSKTETEITTSPRIIIILPDFEAHDEKVLQDFILILSGYGSKLPIVFIFGVASMISAVHDTLPNHVISKLSLELFKTPRSKDFLNSTIDSVFLTPDCPFMISGKVLNFLNEVFLCYDFSLKGLITSLKFCIMDHFFESGCTQYCWPRKNLADVINNLAPEQLTNLKRVPSFAELIEKRKRTNDPPPPKTAQDYKNLIIEKLKELHESIKVFYVGLHCLQILVQDLPEKPLGSDLRELYIKAMISTIIESNEYEECMKTLRFSSKPALIEKLKKILDYLKKPEVQLPTVENCRRKVERLLKKIETASPEVNSASESPSKSPSKKMLQKRGDLSQYCLELQQKKMSEFEIVREEVLKTLTSEVFNELLVKLTKLPFHEELIYNKRSAVKEAMIGMPRGAVVRALANPQKALQCNCCKLRDEGEILKTMPDICIVYKLHLRWATLINVYDWMLSFKSIVEPKSEDDEISSEIHARFTQAVADLQFLGYIKHTNVKKDHVVRLTFER